MKNVGYYNGVIGPIEQMTIPMDDRAVYFGDGVYDATYAANWIIFEADAHIARFFRSAQALRIAPPVTPEALKSELQRCVELIDSAGEVQVYFQCTRGTALRSHPFPEGAANLLITVRELPLTPLSQKGRAILVEDTRYLHCNIKTINLLPNVMANQRAKEAGCCEAILHRGERVTECSHSNVHILKDGVFHTAPTDHLILPGITRAHLLRVCERLGIPSVEAPFTVEELLSADEVLVSSAGMLGLGICEVDGRSVGGRAPDLLAALQRAMVDDFCRETGYRLPVLD